MEFQFLSMIRISFKDVHKGLCTLEVERNVGNYVNGKFEFIKHFISVHFAFHKRNSTFNLIKYHDKLMRGCCSKKFQHFCITFCPLFINFK